MDIGSGRSRDRLRPKDRPREPLLDFFGDLYLYGDSDGKPGNIIGRRTGYTITKKGLNNFSRVSIAPTKVDKIFYAGWTELSEGKAKVGLDYSNDSGDKIFVKVGSVWSQNIDVQGSLMIRPVFGRGGGVVTGNPEQDSNLFTCYPNPSNGTFIVKGKYDQLQIINTTGQFIPYQSELTANEETKITIQSSPGLYLVKVSNGQLTKTIKMIVR
jgi:hypothetical protein